MKSKDQPTGRQKWCVALLPTAYCSRNSGRTKNVEKRKAWIRFLVCVRAIIVACACACAGCRDQSRSSDLLWLWLQNGRHCMMWKYIERMPEFREIRKASSIANSITAALVHIMYKLPFPSHFNYFRLLSSSPPPSVPLTFGDNIR